MSRARVPGKRVRGALYVHATAIGELPLGQRQEITAAQQLAGGFEWNVVRLERARIVGLLLYGSFEADPFPALKMAARINLNVGTVRISDYRKSLNPLILHRKEMLVPASCVAAKEWAALTRRLEALGLFDEPTHIGRRNAWRLLLDKAGLDAQGNPRR